MPTSDACYASRVDVAVRRHQGVYLLGLGIISVFAAFFMVPLGVMAWIRARRDLREMEAGRMDEAGRDLTRLARVLGIISTLIVAFWLLVLVASLSMRPLLEIRHVVEVSR